MRIVTYQGVKFISELIRKENRITADTEAVERELGEYSEYFSKAYNWMCVQMHHRVGHPPKDVKYPIWAWKTYDGMDVATPEGLEASAYNPHLMDGLPIVWQIVLDVPDDKVLLSDEELWHFPLNGWPIMPVCSKRGENALEAMLRDAKPSVCDAFTEESWKWVFEVNRGSQYMAGENQSRYIQACIWEIKPEYIVSVKPMEKNIPPEDAA